MAILENRDSLPVHIKAMGFLQTYCGSCARNEGKFADIRSCMGCKIWDGDKQPTNYIRKIVKDCNICETLDCNSCRKGK